MSFPEWLDRSGGGSPQIECGCGRIHYDESGLHMEDGEFASLKRGEKLNPGRYIGGDAPCAVEFAGRIIVDDCPCRFLQKFEDCVMRERRAVARLIRQITEEEMASARATLQLLVDPDE